MGDNQWISKMHGATIKISLNSIYSLNINICEIGTLMCSLVSDSGGMQTNIKTWLIAGNVERLSEASVYKDATSTGHAVHPSLRGTFLYWVKSVTSTVVVPSWEKNKPWLSPVFASYFPTLQPADNSSWALFTYIEVKVKQCRYRPGVAQRVPGS